jgi:GH24 family phage-related lysozyme (muramidase)
MGTWIKETDVAIYLMQGGYWISRISKFPSQTNPKEQVVNIGSIKDWFKRPDYPTAMTVALGTGAPEPQPLPAPPPKPPAPSGKTNAAGLEIIKHFEGWRADAYLDAVGVWTIGYGHTSKAGPPEVYKGQTITKEEGEEILKRDLLVFENAVSRMVTRTPNSDQFSALVSFTYNFGESQVSTSTLIRKHNSGDFAGAAAEFPKWNHAGQPPQVLPGLTRRRNAERALYLSQDYRQYL